MKKALAVIVAIAFCVVLTATAQAQDSKAQAKLLEYMGKITKIEKPDLIAMQTKEGPMEFFLKHEGGKDCVPLDKLAVGDNVIVSCKEKKDRMEARCVKKVRSGTTLSGGTLQGGTIR